MTELRVTITADTRWATLWVQAMKVAAHAIGPDRAIRAARWGASRLIRYRFDTGRWRWGLDAD